MLLTNTHTRKKEEFKPRSPKEVTMYVCGITPYSETHLGHARAYVTFDILRRFLEWGGAKVKYVQNITDVDDKIIARAATEKKSTSEVAEKYTNDFFEMMDLLGVDRATMYPKATYHIPDIIRII